MEAWGITDPGLVRKSNQDAFLIQRLFENVMLAVVCDGMGGAQAGDIASRMALDVFAGEVAKGYRATLKMKDVAALLSGALKLANDTIYQQAQEDLQLAGMGTTLVAALVDKRGAHIINVGDSRAYFINDSGIQCVTKDHSFVEMMVQRGELSAEAAKRHPKKNLITRAVGTDAAVEGDVFQLKLQQGDNLLLCTDGLYGVMADQEILFEVIHGHQHALCCQSLVDLAVQRGAPDNVTAVLLEA